MLLPSPLILLSTVPTHRLVSIFLHLCASSFTSYSSQYCSNTLPCAHLSSPLCFFLHLLFFSVLFRHIALCASFFTFVLLPSPLILLSTVPTHRLVRIFLHLCASSFTSYSSQYCSDTSPCEHLSSPLCFFLHLLFFSVLFQHITLCASFFTFVLLPSPLILLSTVPTHRLMSIFIHLCASSFTSSFHHHVSPLLFLMSFHTPHGMPLKSHPRSVPTKMELHRQQM